MPYDNRNKFTEAHGGFDTFAEVWQHVEGKMEEYDKLDDAALQARKELDEKISDKKSFAQQLKVAGYDNFAERISSMFSVSSKTRKAPEGGFFSRFRKK